MSSCLLHFFAMGVLNSNAAKSVGGISNTYLKGLLVEGSGIYYLQLIL